MLREMILIALTGTGKDPPTVGGITPWLGSWAVSEKEVWAAVCIALFLNVVVM